MSIDDKLNEAIREARTDSRTKATPQRVNGEAPHVDSTPSEIVSLDELLDSPEEAYDWLVPGLIERGDRGILTGNEGKGKSTLLRQFAAQVAAGVHPFGGEPFPPLRVLLVDCENSRRQIRRKSDRLRKATGATLGLLFRPEGVDLTRGDDVEWLTTKIREFKPDLVVIGPVYKMAGGDPKDEQNAKAVAGSIDYLRVAYGFAVLIEAHSPYADGSKTKRPERPYGASLWSRWPEFGIHLTDDGKLNHWRGQRDEREWPLKLRRGDGDDWPWIVDQAASATAEPETWHGPTHCMDDILEFLKTTAAIEYSGNQLHKAMKGIGSSYRRDTVTAAAEQLAIAHRINVHAGRNNARIFSFRQPEPDFYGANPDF